MSRDKLKVHKIDISKEEALDILNKTSKVIESWVSDKVTIKVEIYLD
jgi:hypothetical protein